MRLRSGLLLALLLGAGHTLTADILYSVTDLGALAGNCCSIGSGLNNAGQVVGSGNTATSISHAFLYSNGQMTDLGTLGGLFSYGRAINNAGQVTGSSNTPGGTLPGSFSTHAFLYRNSQMIDLGTLPGYAASFGSSINDA